MNAHATDAVFWREWPFWLLLSLGPLSWLLMVLSGLPLSKTQPAWNTLLWVVFIYPVLEEYVFRGGLQVALLSRATLKRAALGLSLANVITSALFAAMHLINQPPLWAAAVFLPSLAFGWLRDRYSNIHSSIALHIAYNAGFVWLFS